jgi:hypothetical protein
MYGKLGYLIKGPSAWQFIKLSFVCQTSLFVNLSEYKYTFFFARFQASVAMRMRSALFWDIKQCRVNFMLISPCIVNQFLKMFQQDDTFCTVFYYLQTALHVSGETFPHHQELE